MSHFFDEVSKSLAESAMPRRESLRRLGFAITATVLAPLGASFAQAHHQPQGSTDPCKAFCKCRNRRQQDQCLKACKGCGSNPQRLGGGCGNYFCCSADQTSCGSYCADLDNDPYNCGVCGYECAPPGANEYGGCLGGACVYACVEGAIECDSGCTFLNWDPNNCGACGNVCGGDAPYCSGGECSPCTGGQALCDGSCVEISQDPSNCGGCGILCGPGENCVGGVCQSAEPCSPDNPYWPNC